MRTTSTAAVAVVVAAVVVAVMARTMTLMVIGMITYSSHHQQQHHHLAHPYHHNSCHGCPSHIVTVVWIDSLPRRWSWNALVAPICIASNVIFSFTGWYLPFPSLLTIDIYPVSNPCLAVFFSFTVPYTIVPDVCKISFLFHAHWDKG